MCVCVCVCVVVCYVEKTYSPVKLLKCCLSLHCHPPAASPAAAAVTVAAAWSSTWCCSTQDLADAPWYPFYHSPIRFPRRNPQLSYEPMAVARHRATGQPAKAAYSAASRRQQFLLLHLFLRLLLLTQCHSHCPLTARCWCCCYCCSGCLRSVSPCGDAAMSAADIDAAHWWAGDVDCRRCR